MVDVAYLGMCVMCTFTIRFRVSVTLFSGVVTHDMNIHCSDCAFSYILKCVVFIFILTPASNIHKNIIKIN